jgi:hypothetical protein
VGHFYEVVRYEKSRIRSLFAIQVISNIRIFVVSLLLTKFRIRIGLSAEPDPDPAMYLSEAPDLALEPVCPITLDWKYNFYIFWSGNFKVFFCCLFTVNFVSS